MAFAAAKGRETLCRAEVFHDDFPTLPVTRQQTFQIQVSGLQCFPFWGVKTRPTLAYVRARASVKERPDQNVNHGSVPTRGQVF